MTQQELTARVRAQLAIDLACDVADFDALGIVIREAADLPGRRPFPRGDRHFEMVTMGGDNVIVSASAPLLPQVRAALTGKGRDDAFAAPFVHGQALYFLPAVGRVPDLPLPEGIRLTWAERADIPALYVHEGFYNALGYDAARPRPDVLAVVAWAGEVPVGMSGCSLDAKDLWQVGIDVLPAWRGQGLAAALVARLTREILARDKVPYYGTATSNVASQRVAHRAGYRPGWTCVYRGLFDGQLTGATG